MRSRRGTIVGLSVATAGGVICAAYFLARPPERDGVDGGRSLDLVVSTKPPDHTPTSNPSGADTLEVERTPFVDHAAASVDAPRRMTLRDELGRPLGDAQVGIMRADGADGIVDLRTDALGTAEIQGFDDAEASVFISTLKASEHFDLLTPDAYVFLDSSSTPVDPVDRRMLRIPPEAATCVGVVRRLPYARGRIVPPTTAVVEGSLRLFAVVDGVERELPTIGGVRFSDFALTLPLDDATWPVDGVLTRVRIEAVASCGTMRGEAEQTGPFDGDVLFGDVPMRRVAPDALLRIVDDRGFGISPSAMFWIDPDGNSTPSVVETDAADRSVTRTSRPSWATHLIVRADGCVESRIPSPHPNAEPTSVVLDRFAKLVIDIQGPEGRAYLVTVEDAAGGETHGSSLPKRAYLTDGTGRIDVPPNRALAINVAVDHPLGRSFVHAGVVKRTIRHVVRIVTPPLAPSEWREISIPIARFPTAEVRGTVRHADGSPVPATINIVVNGEGTLPPFVESVRCEPDGSYVFADMPLGEGAIIAACQSLFAKKDVKLLEGANVVDFVLEDAWSGRVDLVDDVGTPVSPISQIHPACAYPLDRSISSEPSIDAPGAAMSPITEAFTSFTARFPKRKGAQVFVSHASATFSVWLDEREPTKPIVLPRPGTLVVTLPKAAVETPFHCVVTGATSCGAAFDREERIFAAIPRGETRHDFAPLVPGAYVLRATTAESTNAGLPPTPTPYGPEVPFKIRSGETTTVVVRK